MTAETGDETEAEAESLISAEVGSTLGDVLAVVSALKFADPDIQ